MKKVGLLVVLFLMMGVSSAWAFCVVHDWADEKAGSDVYYVKAGGMFVRGLHEFVELPVEIGYHTYTETRDNFKYGAGILKGLGMGTLWGVDGALRGAWDIITALIPDYHGEPGEHDTGAELKGEGGGEETT